LINLAAGLVSLGFLVGLGVWGYAQVKRDVSGVPVVRALEGPIRVTPDDPGGVISDHAGLSVNAVKAGDMAVQPTGELILAPEPPALKGEDLPRSALLPSEDPSAKDAESAIAAALAEAATAPLSDTAPTDAIDTIAPPGVNGVSSVLPVEVPSGAPETETAQALAIVDLLTQGETPLSVDEANGADTAAAVDEAVPQPGVPEVVTGPGVTRSLRPPARPVRSSARTEAAPSVQGQDDAIASGVAAAVAAALDTSFPVAPDGVTELAEVAPGTRLVQLGAFDTPDQSRQAWTRIGGLVDGLMDGKARVIQQAEAGGRTFYRLRAHGFYDISDARRFCAALVAEGADCIPVVAR